MFCVHVCPPSVIADSEQEEDESLQSKYPQAVNLTKRAATDYIDEAEIPYPSLRVLWCGVVWCGTQLVYVEERMMMCHSC